MKSEEILSLCCWETRRELSAVGFGADMYLLPSCLLSHTGVPEAGWEFSASCLTQQKWKTEGRSYSA